MSHERLKTKYYEEGPYGTKEERILYVDHNDTCDVVTFYDDEGFSFFSVADTIDNNLFNAIVKLYLPKKDGDETIEYVSGKELDDLINC